MLYNVNNKFKQKPGGLSAIVTSTKQILYTPAESLIIVLVMVCALFLAITSYLLWKNMENFSSNWNDSVEIAVYLKQKVDKKSVNVLVKELSKTPFIAKIRLIRPDEGMKVFMEATSLIALLSSFKENPLPNVIIIYPKIKIMSKDGAIKFVQMLRGYKEVDIVKADMDWIEQSHSWVNLAGKLSAFLVLVLIFNALLILCGASYAMSQVFGNREGASKIILQYQFAWYGLIASLLALFLVKIVLIMLQDGEIFLGGLNSGSAVFIVLTSSLIGFISARMGAFSKY
jgi:cell division transport system permease protein